MLIPVSWKTLQRSVLLVCFSMSVSSLLRSCSSLIISRNCFTLASLLRQSWSSSIISSKYSPIIFTARLLGEGERNVKTNYTKRKNLINLICQLEKLANSRVVCRGSWITQWLDEYQSWVQLFYSAGHPLWQLANIQQWQNEQLDSMSELNHHRPNNALHGDQKKPTGDAGIQSHL